MSRSKFLEAATNAPDPRDAEIAALRAALAARDADIAELTRSQPDRDRLARIRKAKQDDETIDRFRALPDARSRLVALSGIVADHLARRCIESISLDERVELLRIADEATRARLRETIVPRSNWPELELLARDEASLGRWVRVTRSGAALGSERQDVTEEAAQAYEAAGLGAEVIQGAHGRVAIEGWSLHARAYRIERADTWELRLAVDRELATLVREGKLVATPLTADEVRAGILRGELTP